MRLSREFGVTVELEIDIDALQARAVEMNVPVNDLVRHAGWNCVKNGIQRFDRLDGLADIFGEMEIREVWNQ